VSVDDSETALGQNKTNNQVTRTSGGVETTKLVLPNISLQLAIDAPATVHVGQSF